MAGFAVIAIVTSLLNVVFISPAVSNGYGAREISPILSFEQKDRSYEDTIQTAQAPGAPQLNATEKIALGQSVNLQDFIGQTFYGRYQDAASSSGWHVKLSFDGEAPTVEAFGTQYHRYLFVTLDRENLTVSARSSGNSVAIQIDLKTLTMRGVDASARILSGTLVHSSFGCWNNRQFPPEFRCPSFASLAMRERYPELIGSNEEQFQQAVANMRGRYNQLHTVIYPAIQARQLVVAPAPAPTLEVGQTPPQLAQERSPATSIPQAPTATQAVPAPPETRAPGTQPPTLPTPPTAQAAQVPQTSQQSQTVPSVPSLQDLLRGMQRVVEGFEQGTTPGGEQKLPDSTPAPTQSEEQKRIERERASAQHREEQQRIERERAATQQSAPPGRSVQVPQQTSPNSSTEFCAVRDYYVGSLTGNASTLSIWDKPEFENLLEFVPTAAETHGLKISSIHKDRNVLYFRIDGSFSEADCPKLFRSLADARSLRATAIDAGRKRLETLNAYKLREKTLLERIFNYSFCSNEDICGDASFAFYWVSGFEGKNKCVMTNVHVRTNDGKLLHQRDIDIRVLNQNGFRIQYGGLLRFGDEKTSVMETPNVGQVRERLQRAWGLAFQECPGRRSEF